MTLPAVVNNYRKQELHTQLKKAYADLSQINQRIIADGNSLYNISTVYERATLVKKYLKGNFILDPDSDWLGSSTRVSKVLYNNKGLYGHTGSKIVHVWCDNSGAFADNNGRYWLFNDKGKHICIDINGQKGPNRYGYDYFIFYPDETGRILPHYTDIENESFNTDGAGDYRDYTYYALNDLHPSEDNKTYWKDYIKLK